VPWMRSSGRNAPAYKWIGYIRCTCDELKDPKPNSWTRASRSQQKRTRARVLNFQLPSCLVIIIELMFLLLLLSLFAGTRSSVNILIFAIKREICLRLLSWFFNTRRRVGIKENFLGKGLIICLNTARFPFRLNKFWNFFPFAKAIGWDATINLNAPIIQG